MIEKSEYLLIKIHKIILFKFQKVFLFNTQHSLNAFKKQTLGTAHHNSIKPFSGFNLY